MAFRVIIIIITGRRRCRRFLACGECACVCVCVYTERLFHHEVDDVLTRKHRPTSLSHATASL